MSNNEWFKSSYSRGGADNCLEVRWRKSSYSNETGGECLEARLATDAAVDLRDSQHPDHGHLSFHHTEWSAFLQAATHEEL